MVENVENNNFNLYERVYISLSRTVSNFECISEELKQEREEDTLKLLELDEWSKETKDKPSEIVGTKENKIEGMIYRDVKEC